MAKGSSESIVAHHELLPYMLIHLLAQTIRIGDDHPSHEISAALKFNTGRKISVPLQSFVEKFLKSAYCSSACYVIVLIYLDRIARNHPLFHINSHNIHRLFVSSLLIASKVHDEKPQDNLHYSRISGFPIGELNALELEFLNLVQFDTHVDPHTYQEYVERLNQGAREHERILLQMKEKAKMLERYSSEYHEFRNY
eukprot:TRINITY_DN5885_c0_g1_i2.p1 TRINITY_DN5885_c0_g1~~TRINITY_DN5885_c0_g1_i2.p1  ORF type:complete len:197 (+),score=49.43 TRINITY_DN5885_c0_g1_i2:52-642(+)